VLFNKLIVFIARLLILLKLKEIIKIIKVLILKKEFKEVKYFLKIINLLLINLII
jgi:hypothetical protein